MKQIFKRFRRDRRGTIALITAIVLFPLLFLSIGAPIDLARSIQLRSALQNAADSGALAAEEDIANGARPSQACQMMFNYAVSYIFSPGGIGSFATAAATSPGTSCTDTLPGTTPTPTTATATGNVPNSATFTATATIPATFTSYLMKNIPVAVSATATGPQGFITVCVTPTGSGSADLDQAYFYLRNTDNTLTNQDGSLITQADSPGLSIGPGKSISSGSGVAIADFLVDNYRTGPHGPNVATVTYCDPPTNSQIAVTVKTGLGQRLGFEFVVVTGGQYPCYYAGQGTGFGCLSSGTAYAYNPYSSTSALTGGNVNGFASYYNEYTTSNLSSYYTNAYGTPVGTESIFYSTDYPTTYNTSNANTVIYDHLVNGIHLPVTSVTPIANNSCYEVTPILGSLSPVFNGYGTLSQGCLMSQALATNSAGYGASNGATSIVRWGYMSQGSYLVCTVNDGTNNYNGTAASPAITTSTAAGGYAAITGTSSSSNLQQENMVIANTSSAGSSAGPNIFKCPVNTLGSPYYPDPTCAELGGSTLQIGWNDMGGLQNDNGVSGGVGSDLYYTYSCQQPTANSATLTALTQ